MRGKKTKNDRASSAKATPPLKKPATIAKSSSTKKSAKSTPAVKSTPAKKSTPATKSVGKLAAVKSGSSKALPTELASDAATPQLGSKRVAKTSPKSATTQAGRKKGAKASLNPQSGSTRGVKAASKPTTPQLKASRASPKVAVPILGDVKGASAMTPQVEDGKGAKASPNLPKSAGTGSSGKKGKRKRSATVADTPSAEDTSSRDAVSVKEESPEQDKDSSLTSEPKAKRRRTNPSSTATKGAASSASAVKTCSNCGTVSAKPMSKKCHNCQKFFYDHWAQRCRIPPCPKCHFSRKARGCAMVPKSCERCGYQLTRNEDRESVASQESGQLEVGKKGDTTEATTVQGGEATIGSQGEATIIQDPSEIANQDPVETASVNAVDSKAVAEPDASSRSTPGRSMKEDSEVVSLHEKPEEVAVPDSNVLTDDVTMSANVMEDASSGSTASIEKAKEVSANAPSDLEAISVETKAKIMTMEQDIPPSLQTGSDESEADILKGDRDVLEADSDRTKAESVKDISTGLDAQNDEMEAKCLLAEENVLPSLEADLKLETGDVTSGPTVAHKAESDKFRVVSDLPSVSTADRDMLMAESVLIKPGESDVSPTYTAARSAEPAPVISEQQGSATVTSGCKDMPTAESPLVTAAKKESPDLPLSLTKHVLEKPTSASSSDSPPPLHEAEGDTMDTATSAMEAVSASDESSLERMDVDSTLPDSSTEAADLKMTPSNKVAQEAATVGGADKVASETTCTDVRCPENAAQVSSGEVETQHSLNSESTRAQSASAENRATPGKVQSVPTESGEVVPVEKAENLSTAAEKGNRAACILDQNGELQDHPSGLLQKARASVLSFQTPAQQTANLPESTVQRLSPAEEQITNAANSFKAMSGDTAGGKVMSGGATPVLVYAITPQTDPVCPGFISDQPQLSLNLVASGSKPVVEQDTPPASSDHPPGAASPLDDLPQISDMMTNLENATTVIASSSENLKWGSPDGGEEEAEDPPCEKEVDKYMEFCKLSAAADSGCNEVGLASMVKGAGNKDGKKKQKEEGKSEGDASPKRKLKELRPKFVPGQSGQSSSQGGLSNLGPLMTIQLAQILNQMQLPPVSTMQQLNEKIAVPSLESAQTHCSPQPTSSASDVIVSPAVACGNGGAATPSPTATVLSSDTSQNPILLPAIPINFPLSSQSKLPSVADVMALVEHTKKANIASTGMGGVPEASLLSHTVAASSVLGSGAVMPPPLLPATSRDLLQHHAPVVRPSTCASELVKAKMSASCPPPLKSIPQRTQDNSVVKVSRSQSDTTAKPPALVPEGGGGGMPKVSVPDFASNVQLLAKTLISDTTKLAATLAHKLKAAKVHPPVGANIPAPIKPKEVPATTPELTSSTENTAASSSAFHKLDLSLSSASSQMGNKIRVSLLKRMAEQQQAIIADEQTPLTSFPSSSLPPVTTTLSSSTLPTSKPFALVLPSPPLAAPIPVVSGATPVPPNSKYQNFAVSPILSVLPHQTVEPGKSEGGVNQEGVMPMSGVKRGVDDIAVNFSTSSDYVISSAFSVGSSASNVVPTASNVATSASGVAVLVSSASGLAPTFFTSASAFASNLTTSVSGLAPLASNMSTSVSGLAPLASNLSTSVSGLAPLAPNLSTSASVPALPSAASMMRDLDASKKLDTAFIEKLASKVQLQIKDALTSSATCVDDMDTKAPTPPTSRIMSSYRKILPNIAKQSASAQQLSSSSSSFTHVRTPGVVTVQVCSSIPSSLTLSSITNPGGDLAMSSAAAAGGVVSDSVRKPGIIKPRNGGGGNVRVTPLSPTVLPTVAQIVTAKPVLSREVRISVLVCGVLAVHSVIYKNDYGRMNYITSLKYCRVHSIFRYGPEIYGLYWQKLAWMLCPCIRTHVQLISAAFEHSMLRVWEIYALENAMVYITLYGLYKP